MIDIQSLGCVLFIPLPEYSQENHILDHGLQREGGHVSAILSCKFNLVIAAD